MGPPKYYTNFVNAVIDEAAFNSIMKYIYHAKKPNDITIIADGKGDNCFGYFIEPTILTIKKLNYVIMHKI